MTEFTVVTSMTSRVLRITILHTTKHTLTVTDLSGSWEAKSQVTQEMISSLTKVFIKNTRLG